MVALLDIEDLIVALGRSPVDAAEAAKWQFNIDGVSAFINGYVTVSFEELEDDVVRFPANYYGEVCFGGDPVSAVSSVKDARSGLETVWDWDLLTKIYYLEPNQVVDVTYTHGYAAVPADVSYMATQAVLGILNLGGAGTLTSFTVGDVTEVYENARDDGTVATVVSLSSTVLDKYTDSDHSLRLGSSLRFASSQQLPTL